MQCNTDSSRLLPTRLLELRGNICKAEVRSSLSAITHSGISANASRANFSPSWHVMYWRLEVCARYGFSLNLPSKIVLPNSNRRVGRSLDLLT